MANSNYSESFSTTKLGTIATGYRLSITTGGDEPSNVPTDAVLVSKGKTSRRDFEGTTYNYSDPLFDALNKMTLMMGHEGLSPEGIGKSGNSVNVLNPMQATEIMIAFASGDLESFLTYFLADGKISLNIIPSRTMKSLKSNKTGDIYSGSLNQASQIFVNGKFFTAQLIVSTFLPIMGVEMYWMGGNKFDIKEPTIMHPEDVLSVVVPDKDILDMTVGTDVYNMPDIIFPNFPNFSGIEKAGWDHTLASAIGDLNSNSGSANLKIATYDVPSPVAQAFSMGHLIAAATKDETTGIVKNDNKTTQSILASFYANLAMSSNMYNMDSGSITLEYSPQIVIPAHWYNVGGKKVFVSDIRHEVTRFRKVTILTIAGVDGSIPSPAGTIRMDASYNDETFDQTKKAVKKDDENVKKKRVAAASEKQKPKEVKNGKKNISNELPRETDRPDDTVANKRSSW